MKIPQLVFSATSPHPGTHPEVPCFRKRHSYCPENDKDFRSPVEGTGVKDHILEQRVFSVLFSLRELQGFQELCGRSQGPRKYIFSIRPQYLTHMILLLSF